MNMQHFESTDAMVTYHQERVAAAMRAAESDSAVIRSLRARLGVHLISLGERLRGECALDCMAPVQVQPQPLVKHG